MRDFIPIKFLPSLRTSVWLGQVSFATAYSRFRKLRRARPVIGGESVKEERSAVDVLSVLSDRRFLWIMLSFILAFRFKRPRSNRASRQIALQKSFLEREDPSDGAAAVVVGGHFIAPFVTQKPFLPGLTNGSGWLLAQTTATGWLLAIELSC